MNTDLGNILNLERYFSREEKVCPIRSRNAGLKTYFKNVSSLKYGVSPRFWRYTADEEARADLERVYAWTDVENNNTMQYFVWYKVISRHKPTQDGFQYNWELKWMDLNGVLLALRKLYSSQDETGVDMTGPSAGTILILYFNTENRSRTNIEPLIPWVFYGGKFKNNQLHNFQKTSILF